MRLARPLLGTVAAAGVLAVTLAACSSSRSAPNAASTQNAKSTPSAGASSSSAAGSSSSGEVHDLTIGLSAIDFNAATFWVGQDRGFFKKYGLNVKFVVFKGNTPAVQAVVSGSSPVVIAGASGVVSAIHAGANSIIMLGALAQKLAFDLVVTPNITDAKQLEGKKCMVSSHGSTSDLALRLALKTANVDASKVTILTGGNETARITALQTGQVQCTSLTTGLDLGLVHSGKAKILLSDAKANQLVTQLAVTVNKNWYGAHKDLMVDLMKGLTASLAYEKNPANIDDVVKIVHAHLDLKNMTDADLKQTMQQYAADFFPTYPTIDPSGLQFLIDNDGYKGMDVKSMYDLSIVNQLQQDNFAKTAAS